MGVNDIVPGVRFGNLTVQYECEPKIFGDGSKSRQFLCRCDCGNTKVVVGRYLFRGETKTCGMCPRYNITSSIHYSRASHILDRCNNPNSDSYQWYGARGIKCKLGNTAGEVAMALESIPGYFEGAQIDRIDNNGHYELGNLRWATPHENSMNTRRVLSLEDIESKSFTSNAFTSICDRRGWDVNDFEREKDTTTRNQWFYTKKTKI